MARVVAIDPTKEMISEEFTTTSRGFWLSSTGLMNKNEKITVERLQVGSETEYEPATSASLKPSTSPKD